jgi:TonB family protein
MTAITHAFSGALLHFLWEGLTVFLALWAALFALRKSRAQVRYAVSCAALAAMVLLPVFTTLAIYERPAAAHAPAAVPAGSGGAQAAALPQRLPTDWMAWAQQWAAPVWACGVLLFSVRLAWGWNAVAAMRRRSEESGEEIAAKVAALAARMGVGRPVRVLIAAVTDSPSVTGWLRPVILLPAAALAGLTPEQLEAVLAHELAHIRRHDYLVNVLQMAVETLLFYHPAVWWISNRIRDEREMCCDDLAVRAAGGALCYARALTALEKMRASRPAMALGAVDGPLLYRIRRVMNAAGGECGPSKWSGAAALAVGLICLGASVNWAQDRPRQEVSIDTGGAVLLHRAPIEYSETLKEKGVEGTVLLEATMDAAGNVVDARVVSGPEALRKAALTSVLNWHFAPGGQRTNLVQIAFHAPTGKEGAQTNENRREAQTKENRAGARVVERSSVTVTTPTEPGNGEWRRTAEATTRGPEPGTVEWAERELESARAYLARAESLPNSERNIDEIVRARNRVAEWERTFQAVKGGETVNRAAAFREREREGRTVAAIEIRGMSDEAGGELLARLPVQQGQTLSSERIESVRRAVREFDEHLEVGFGMEGDGAVIRIHPRGLADAPLVRR